MKVKTILLQTTIPRMKAMKYLSVKGQSLAEAAITLATVGLAILAMQVYLQRGIQAKTKVLTDTIIGEEQRASSSIEELGSTDTDSFSKIKVITTKRIDAEHKGSVTKDIIRDQTNTRSETWTTEKQ